MMELFQIIPMNIMVDLKVKKQTQFAEELKDKSNIGIFMCGSGIGVNMVANRYKGIRAVCANDYVLAYLARKDEDANVLTMGARLLSDRAIIKTIKVFLTSEFEGGRHLRRINKF